MAKLTKSEWTEVALGGFLIALIAWLIYHGGNAMTSDQSTPVPPAPVEAGGVPGINVTAPYYPPETFTANPLQTFEPIQVTTLGTPGLIFINAIGQPTYGDCSCCEAGGDCNSIVSAPPISYASFSRAI